MTGRRASLRGKPALITGAGGGIGRATSLLLAASGYDVLSVDIDGAAGKDTAALCEPAGHAYEADVADAEWVSRLADQVRADHEVPVVLVNNAGIGMSAPFLDTTLEDWERIVGVNLMGIVNMTRQFAPDMLAVGAGHVVNIASGLGYAATASEPAYCATKAAVISLSRSMRADWHAQGVGVSVICPGIINTAIIERTTFRGASADPEKVARTRRMFSHGHSPELVARAVLRAIEDDRVLVPVGIEAHIGWALRHLPVSVSDLLARAATRLR